MADTDKTTRTKVVLISDQGAPSARRVRINGAEFDIAGASPIWQGGIGISLTLFNVDLSDETIPAPQPAAPGVPTA